jgi:hypothetical protein
VVEVLLADRQVDALQTLTIKQTNNQSINHYCKKTQWQTAGTNLSARSPSEHRFRVKLVLARVWVRVIDSSDAAHCIII